MWAESGDSLCVCDVCCVTACMRVCVDVVVCRLGRVTGASTGTVTSHPGAVTAVVSVGADLVHACDTLAAAAAAAQRRRGTHARAVRAGGAGGAG